MSPDAIMSEVRVLPSGMARSDPEARHYAVVVRYVGTYVQRGTEGEQDWYAIENGGSSGRAALVAAQIARSFPGSTVTVRPLDGRRPLLTFAS